ncbi:ABC transporter permease, partial [Nocardiopsis coralliicola]
GRPLVALLPVELRGDGAAPEPPAVPAEPVALVLAFGTGCAVAMAGVWGPARRIRRVQPVEALRDASVDTHAMTAGRWVLGAGAAAATALSGYGLARAEGDGMVPLSVLTGMGAILTAAFLAPVVIPPLARLLTAPLSRLPGAGAVPQLVRESMTASVRRTASLCAPVLLTVGLTGVLAGPVAVTSAASAAATLPWTAADATATASGAAASGDGQGGGGVPERLLAALARGGAEVAELREIDVAPVGAEPDAAPALDGTALAVDPAAITAAIDPPASDGAFADLAPGGAALAEGDAAALGAAAGDTVEVRIGAGGDSVRLRVDAVLAAGPWNGFSYIAPPDGIGGGPVRFAYLGAPSGADPEEARAAWAEASGGAPVRIDAAGAVEPGREGNDRLVRLFGAVLLTAVLLSSCTAIAGTLVMSAVDRRHDLAALRRAGASRRQVLGAVAGEALGVTAVGALLGTGVTVAVLAVLRSALTAWAPAVPLAVPWGLLLGLTALCTVIALPAAVLPVNAALRAADRDAGLNRRMRNRAPADRGRSR